MQDRTQPSLSSRHMDGYSFNTWPSWSVQYLPCKWSIWLPRNCTPVVGLGLLVLAQLQASQPREHLTVVVLCIHLKQQLCMQEFQMMLTHNCNISAAGCCCSMLMNAHLTLLQGLLEVFLLHGRFGGLQTRFYLLGRHGF